MTGIYDINRNVTPGLFDLIGLVNTYVATLMHSGIIKFSQMVCFSRASFPDHEKTRWRVLDRGIVLKMALVLMRCLLGLLGFTGPISGAS